MWAAPVDFEIPDRETTAGPCPCVKSPSGSGEKLSWRVVAAPMLCGGDGHTKKRQGGHISFLTSKQKKEANHGTGRILPLVTELESLHPLDLSEFSNLCTEAEKPHTC